MTWQMPWRRSRPEREFTRAPQPQDAKSAWPGGFLAFSAMTDAVWSEQGYSALAREGYTRNPIVYRAVRLIAETASAIPWLLYEGAREHERHPLLDLLERPNPTEAGASFLESLYGYLLLSGNAYLHFAATTAGAPGLFLLRPDRVSVVAGTDGWPEAYSYEVSGHRAELPVLGAGEGGGVIHLRLFHPLDDLKGFAPLGAALMALDTHNATASWNKALLDNSARPSGALVYAPADGGNLTEDQYERLKAELEEGYAGSMRAGRPLLLEGGLDWKPMSMTPKDMDFIEAKNAASREIALAFGVPPMLLGIPGDNTYSNYSEANRAFYRLTVLPLVGRLARELTARLGPRFGRDLRLWYDADRVEGLSVERDLLWSRIAAADFLTDDEKREAVGYAPRRAAAASPDPSKE